MSQDLSQETRLTRRQHPYFSLDNSIFDSGLAAKAGPHAFSLYAYLCRRAGQSSVAWPSQATMAKNCGISVRMVDKCIQKLESIGLIRRNGWKDQTREIEIMGPSDTAPHADPSAPCADPSAPCADPLCTTCRPPSAPCADNKDTVDKDTMIKTHDKEPAAAGAQTELLTPNEAPPKLPGNLKAETWEAFKAVRKKKRAPMTDHGEKLLFRELRKLVADGQDAQQVVEQSIMRAWTGLFPVRDPNDRFGRQPEREVTWEEIAEKTYAEPGRRCI